MTDPNKDPYLSELDSMDTFDPPPTDMHSDMESVGDSGEPTVHDPVPMEEVTRFDVEAPAPSAFEAPIQEDAGVIHDDVVPEGPAPVKDLLDLSPDLTVPLVVVMGRKAFTVQDLLALRIGQIMDLERAPTEPVDLVAAGKVVGKGELVEVDGKLGIRILKLLK